MFIYLVPYIFCFLWFQGTRKNEAAAKNKGMFFIFFLYLALFVGLGDMIGGYDRYIYGGTFDYIADSIRLEGGNAIGQLADQYVQGKEYGYFYWEVLVAMITPNRYMFILFTTLLIYTLFYTAMIRYMEDYPLVGLFFLAFLYYFTMTYLRQMIAVGILMHSVPYLLKRNFLWFSLLCVLGYLFHSSAAIFFIMWFVPIKKHTLNALLRFFIIIALVGAVTPLPSMFFASAGDASGMVGRTSAYVDQMGGLRLDYLLEAFVFIYTLYRNYHLIEPYDKKTIVFLNIYVGFITVLLFFVRFGQGGRFGWYFFVGLMYILTIIFRKSTYLDLRRLLVLMTFLMFFRVTYYWSIEQLLPYKTFFTNGIPSGPLVYEKFEYDFMYTQDKFYRPAFDVIL